MRHLIKLQNSLYFGLYNTLTMAKGRFGAFSTSVNDANHESLSMSLENGLPRLIVPLPSRRETCKFTLKPLSHTVGDLSNFIKEEDRGIDRVALYDENETRIALSTSIESLFTSRMFYLLVNDEKYTVNVHDQMSRDLEEVQEKMADLRSTILQLHTALNVDEYQLQKHRELTQNLHQLQQAIEPLEAERLTIGEAAAQKTRILTWVGLGGLGIQFGLLARLTWWEYSWDIMEPVTYFVGTGTAIATYAYYVLTRQEYLLPQVFDREYLKKFHGLAQKKAFDVEKYNDLRGQISKVESDISRLRDPLLFKLPLQQNSLQDHDSILPK